MLVQTFGQNVRLGNFPDTLVDANPKFNLAAELAALSEVISEEVSS